MNKIFSIYLFFRWKGRAWVGCFLLCLSLLFGSAGCQPSLLFPEHGHAVLATNSTFESAAREFMDEDSLFIARLSEPGTCPGHFDIRPDQSVIIRQCPVVLRFDFQTGLDSKIKSLTDGPEKKMVVIHNEGGLCMPESYTNICGAIGKALVEQGWLANEDYLVRMEGIQQRMERLSKEVQNQLAPYLTKKLTVLSSAHQKMFCEWLGLQVVATFSSNDNFSIGELVQSVEQGSNAQVSCVVANEPEGRRTADLLAEKLDVPVVMFGNFPSLDAEHPFDALLRGNVRRLCEVL